MESLIFSNHCKILQSSARKMTVTFCETESINIKRTKNIISLFLIWINELKYFWKICIFKFYEIFSSRISRLELDQFEKMPINLYRLTTTWTMLHGP